MQLQQQTSRATRLVEAEVLQPFRFNDGAAMRETKKGEVVKLELWLANGLANHNPPKIGPATDLGRKAQNRAAA